MIENGRTVEAAVLVPAEGAGTSTTTVYARRPGTPTRR